MERHKIWQRSTSTSGFALFPGHSSTTYIESLDGETRDSIMSCGNSRCVSNNGAKIDVDSRHSSDQTLAEGG